MLFQEAAGKGDSLAKAMAEKLEVLGLDPEMTSRLSQTHLCNRESCSFATRIIYIIYKYIQYIYIYSDTYPHTHTLRLIMLPLPELSFGLGSRSM